MERINAREVKLTEAEEIVREWHTTLLDAGFGQHEAVATILDRVPIDGPTWNLLNQQDFRDWLTGSSQPQSVCGKTAVIGKADPTLVECDLTPHDDNKHEAPDPWGADNVRVRWEGGGTCADDALPARKFEWVHTS